MISVLYSSKILFLSPSKCLRVVLKKYKESSYGKTLIFIALPDVKNEFLKCQTLIFNFLSLLDWKMNETFSVQPSNPSFGSRKQVLLVLNQEEKKPHLTYMPFLDNCVSLFSVSLTCSPVNEFFLLKNSSNVNEVIRTVLNSLFFKLPKAPKAPKARKAPKRTKTQSSKNAKRYKPTKIRSVLQKHPTGKKLLIRLFAFLCLQKNRNVPPM